MFSGLLALVHMEESSRHHIVILHPSYLVTNLTPPTPTPTILPSNPNPFFWITFPPLVSLQSSYQLDYRLDCVILLPSLYNLIEPLIEL